MSVRDVVEDFVRQGPLPDWSASEEVIALRERQLRAIARPVTDEEAERLVGCFGPDDCYGLAWTLLHLIETAPGARVVKVEPDPGANEWVRGLWARGHREL